MAFGQEVNQFRFCNYIRADILLNCKSRSRDALLEFPRTPGHTEQCGRHRAECFRYLKRALFAVGFVSANALLSEVQRYQNEKSFLNLAESRFRVRGQPFVWELAPWQPRIKNPAPAGSTPQECSFDGMRPSRGAVNPALEGDAGSEPAAMRGSACTRLWAR